MTEHIDIEKLADYAEGLLDSAESARVSRHLTECASCAEQHAALAEVPAFLSALPPPSMPPDIATRIEAAIDDEVRARSSHSATAAAPSEGATVIPMRPRARRWIAPLTAAAAAVVVVGGGFAVVKQLAGGGGEGGDGDSSGKAAPPSSQVLREPAAPSVTNSGTDYTHDGLGSQVNTAVKKSQAGSGGLQPKSEGRESSAPPLPSSVAGCVNRISDKVGSSPLLIDRGTYQGRPVQVIVFRKAATPSRYDVWIVGSGCSARADGVVTHTTVPRHP